MHHLTAAKSGSWYICLIFLFALAFTYGCHDSDPLGPDADSFKASVFVEVVDSYGNPVTDAIIRTLQGKEGSLTVHYYGLTDKRGVMALRNIDLFSSTYVTVSKEGYFEGSRRFYPAAGKSHHIRVMLLEESYAGDFSAQNGGSFNVHNNLRLNFIPGSIATENGQPYTGDVEVFVKTIPADDEALSEKMPGDLVGINTSGKKGALGSLGMIAVTLRSPSGDRLQVMSGFAVETRMKVPPSFLSKAPYTIPMWYFDESDGYWNEEGSATLVDDEYVAQLTHFSFWNYDAWFEVVKWGATFVYENGSPASQILVCITIESLGVQTCSYTDEDGFVCGAVAADESLLVHVKTPWCNQVIYSQSYGPYSDSTNIGTVTIPASSLIFSTVHGIALKCNGDPITDGYVNVNVQGYNSFVLVDVITGAFDLTVLNCAQDDIRVIVYDALHTKESHPVVFPYAQEVDAGSITACEELQEFIKLTATGLPGTYSFIFPNAYRNEAGTTTIVSQDSLNNRIFFARFDGGIPGTYVAANSTIHFELSNGADAWSDSLTVTITYYGAPDDYITGTFTGILHTGDPGQQGQDYPLEGSFNVRRRD